MCKCKNANATPITKLCIESDVGKTGRHSPKAKITQFPLRLCYALTVHKSQGQTIKRPTCIVADVETFFGENMAYVAFSRVESLEQLFIINFKESNIRTGIQCIEKVIELRQKSDVAKDSWYECDPTILKISSLNVRSLQKHLLLYHS